MLAAFFVGAFLGVVITGFLWFGSALEYDEHLIQSALKDESVTLNDGYMYRIMQVERYNRLQRQAAKALKAAQHRAH